MMKFVCRAVPAVLALTTFAVTGAAPAVKVPMSAEHWRMLDADSMGPKSKAEFLQKEGFPEGLLVLKQGSAALNGVVFRNGTIEYDFKPLASDMPGFQFRVSGSDRDPDGEEVYQRLFGDERASNDGIQYAPMIHGFMLWNVYPQYQSQAPLVSGWNHVRIVVSGQRMNVFINRSAEPVLSVGNLESGSMVGGLRLRGPAVFANLAITADATDGLSPRPEPDPRAPDLGIVRHWELSSLQALDRNHLPAYSAMPAAATPWRPVEAERGGLVNLNRQYVANDDPAAYSWLRTTVTASHAGMQRVSLGWLGQVWIFVNGKLLTTGKNFYYPEGERRSPDGRISFENGSFDVPLRIGKNEIAIALYSATHDEFKTRTKYGWGLLMRVQNPAGLSFEGQGSSHSRRRP